MLVSKKQEWELYQEEPAPVITTSKPSLNTGLRAKCLIVVVLLALIAMFVTVRSEAIIRAGYDLVQLKAQLIKAEKENELLRLEIAKLKSPQRIQAIAANELGMVVPPDVYVINSEHQVRGEMAAGEKQNLWSSITSALKNGKTEAGRDIKN